MLPLLGVRVPGVGVAAAANRVQRTHTSSTMTATTMMAGTGSAHTPASCCSTTTDSTRARTAVLALPPFQLLLLVSVSRDVGGSCRARCESCRACGTPAAARRVNLGTPAAACVRSRGKPAPRTQAAGMAAASLVGAGGGGERVVARNGHRGACVRAARCDHHAGWIASGPAAHRRRTGSSGTQPLRQPAGTGGPLQAARRARHMWDGWSVLWWRHVACRPTHAARAPTATCRQRTHRVTPSHPHTHTRS